MKIIDGKKLANSIQLELAKKIYTMQQKPSLAVILVGNNPASVLYVNLKEKACKKVGINFHKYIFDENTLKEDIILAIEFLNSDFETDAILVQLPLPNRQWEDEIINSINPQKDVDGFCKENLNTIKKQNTNIISGLASSITNLIFSTKENLINKHAVILCNTEIFAIPIKHILQQHQITSETLFEDTKNKTQKLKQADIIITAIGKANSLHSEMVKNNTIIIDVGINETQNGIVGDCDYKSFLKLNGYITPVPGGVGPMTVAMLLTNVLKLSLLNQNKSIAE